MPHQTFKRVQYITIKMRNSVILGLNYFYFSNPQILLQRYDLFEEF